MSSINQVDIISQYLRIETNYAVIINGHYGVGKTHFFKNELTKQIEKIALPKNEQKHYTPIHISLFGYKSLEEIQTAIFVEIFPILKNRKLKLAAGIGKSIVRGIAQLNQVGDIDKYIGDITQDTDDWLNYDELVICFDDLDRKSEALDLKDVFGFINSLVENQGAKILIIANEEQLIKDENYSSEVREKVIGVSVQYSPDPASVYDEIIKTRYSAADTIFFDFLSSNKAIIVEMIEKNQNNFRNLIFFLEHFKAIFYPIEKIFQDDADFQVRKNEKLDAILNFTLAITFEYKLGHLNSTNFKEIEGINNDILSNIDLAQLLASQNKEKLDSKDEEPSYIQTFRTKYFSQSKFFFFKTIFEYIVGYKAFEPNMLKEELESYFIAQDGEILPQDILLERLAYLDCLKLSTKEYRSLTSEMLSYLDKGEFQLRQYSTILHYATRFNNLLNFDLDKLKKRFKKGISRGSSHYTYNYDLGFHMTVSEDIEFKEDVIEIVKYCLDINETLKETKNKSDLTELLDLFNSDYDSFIDKVKSKDSQYRFEPFWIELDPKSVYRRIKRLDNDKIWSFGHYINDRYRHIFEGLFPEKSFVQNLRMQIDNTTKSRRQRTLQNAALNYVSKCLTEIEKNFPN